MLEARHYSAAGAPREALFALPTDYFDGTVNEPVLHQAVKVFLNNQRQGTAKTKGRSEVSGGNQKPWKQKGTGRARQGSTRAPHWRGGGIVFGPQPRDYRTEMPRKIKQLARRSALNARARESAMHVVERLTFGTPKTSQLAELLLALGIGGRKVLVLTAGHNPNVYLSGRNLPAVQVMRYTDASAYDVLWSEAVVVEEGAITGVTPPESDEPMEAEARPAAKPTDRTTKRAASTGATDGATEGATRKSAKKASSTSRAKATKSATAKKSTAKKPASKPAAQKGSRKGARRKETE